MTRYILNILIAIDQFFNTLIGGYPDETISASCWIGEQQGKILPCFFRPIIDFIFRPFGTDHCRLAYESEVNRLQLPNTYRKAAQPE